MKKFCLILLTGLILLSCNDNSGGSDSSETNNSNSDSGTVSISLSGVPFNTEDLSRINLKINEVRADIGSEDGEEWVSLINFDPGTDVNLLDYLGENALPLAEEILLPAGQVNQVRFLLDAPEEDEDAESTGCYLLYDYGGGETSTEPLVIPSGSSSGLKAVGVFTIPGNGSVDITVSFDARRFVVLGDGTVKMKPVLWVINENEAGTIQGTVTPTDEISSYPELGLFAYESGDYDSSQLDPDEDGIQFPDAVYNCFVNADDGSYVLPYLAPGAYDLVLAYAGAEGFEELQREEGIELEQGETVIYNIEIGTP